MSQIRPAADVVQSPTEECDKALSTGRIEPLLFIVKQIFLTEQLNNKGFFMLFNIAPEPIILLAGGILLLFFPKLLRSGVAIILSTVAYFQAETKTLIPATILPGTPAKNSIKDILQFDLSDKTTSQRRNYYEIRHTGSDRRQTASGERKSQGDRRENNQRF